MKTIHVGFLILVLLLPVSAFSMIPGKYDLLAPYTPPLARSLDKVTMIEVFSFDCGHCYHFNRDIIPRLKKTFGSKLEFVSKPIGWRGHDPGRLYFIAEEQGKGHDVKMMIFYLIFDAGLQGQMFTRDKLQFVARKHGLMKEFESMMDAPRIVEKMNQSVQFSESRNIRSTPTLIIEQALVPIREYSNLVLIINSLLKEPVR